MAPHGDFDQTLLNVLLFTSCVEVINTYMFCRPAYNSERVRLFWCDGTLKKEAPNRVANVARHDEPTINHAEVLPGDYCGLKTFFGTRDDDVLDVLHEVQLVEDVKARHVLDPDVGDQLEPRLPRREVPILTPRVNTLKSEVERLGGRQDVLGDQKIVRSRLIVFHQPQ